MPSASDYPKEVTPRYTGKMFQPFETGQRVEYANIGSAVRDRIDTLSRTLTGTTFYPEQNFAERLLVDPTGGAQLVKAEQIINRLAADARPKQLTDVRMI